MKKLIALLALALCVSGPGAFAQAEGGDQPQAQPAPGQGGGGGGRGGFGRMDNNGDGKISADEFRGPQEMFANIDTDKDGSISQEEMQAGRQQMRGQFGGGQGGPGRFMETLKEQLGATDEEWKVLEPRIQRVQEASAKLRPGFGGGRGGRGGDRGPGGPGGPDGSRGPGANQLPEARALRATLENKEAPADEIKAKLTALRDARKKAQEELDAARKDLQDVVTTRQEAVLVSFSILD